MKKIIIVVALAILSVASLSAQNKFRGVISYSVTSTGDEPVQIPAESATAEVKVFDDKVMTSSSVFTNSPMVNSVLVDGMKQYSCMDMSMIFAYLSAAGVELDYNGPSKILIKHEYTQNEVDSLTIPVTEGFYIEYASDSKTVAGMTAKKAIIHAFGEDGEDHPVVIWYSDEMGPAVNFLFNGIHGVALEYSMDLGEGRQITLTATDIKKGKVKDVDMLLPDGFEELPDDQVKALFEQISEEMKYLQEE